MQLEPGQHIHIVGIGGAGMNPIACVLHEQGFRISGSDLRRSPSTDRLAQAGVTVYEGHAAGNIAGADIVAISSAVPADNPEVVAARAAGIPVIKRAELLGAMTRGKKTIAIAGTHGKTTTTSMMALAFVRAGVDPSFIAGGDIPNLDTNAHAGSSDYFIIEADEYDGCFLGLHLWMAVVTNVEADHLDLYNDMSAIETAFHTFMEHVPANGELLVCADTPRALALAQGLAAPVQTYGLAAGDWQASNITPNVEGGNSFTAVHQGKLKGTFSLRVPGRHNVQNAMAVIATANHCRLDLATVGAALHEFQGAKRRFEVRGTVNGVTVVDDYAHHPTEIRAVLAAALERNPKRLIAVFQPHTYNRTWHLFDEFTQAFHNADIAVLTEILSPAGREQQTWGMSGTLLAEAVQKASPEVKVQFVPSVAEIPAMLAPLVQSGDLVMMLGAGDIYKASEQLLALLQQGHGIMAATSERG